MPDIRTLWYTPRTVDAFVRQNIGGGDWRDLPPWLEQECDLITAVLISLFSDRRALVDDLLPDDTRRVDGTVLRGSGDRRGWWGDAVYWIIAGGVQPEPIGSRLWLLAREKTIPSTARRARLYAQEALAWITRPDNEGRVVASRVTVSAEFRRGAQIGWMDLGVRIERPRRPDFEPKFAFMWDRLTACLADEAPAGGFPVNVTWDATTVTWDATTWTWDHA